MQTSRVQQWTQGPPCVAIQRPFCEQNTWWLGNWGWSFEMKEGH